MATEWTIHAVSRPTLDGWAYVVIAGKWNQKADTFSFDVDGSHHEFYRRGRPIFASWSEGVRWVKQHGYPIG